MNSWFGIALLCASLTCFAERAMDCSGAEHQRKNLIEVREFTCDSPVSCSVAVWAPLEIEEHLFTGFAAILNYIGPDEYDLVVGIIHEEVGNEAVGFLYGTVHTLERVKVSTAYQAKGRGCPLQSAVELKHNKPLNGDAASGAR